MDTQANLFRYFNQQETDSSQTIAYPLVDGAKKLCECGCGKETKIVDENNRTLGYKKGMPLRFIKGHNARLGFKKLNINNKYLISFYYLLGVYYGDGIRTRSGIGLIAKDKDFVENYKFACDKYFNTNIKITRFGKNKGYPYYCSRFFSVKVAELFKQYNINKLKNLSRNKIGAFLRGFFDSEGNAQLYKIKDGRLNSYMRNISSFNTDKKLMIFIETLVKKFGINCRLILKRKGGEIHKKDLYELKLNQSKDNYILFRKVIGFSIKRKQKVVEQIISTYQDKNYRSSICLRNARNMRSIYTKNKREIILKSVLYLLKKFEYPTMNFCQQNIRGYYRLLHWYTHRELLRLARGVQN